MYKKILALLLSFCIVSINLINIYASTEYASTVGSLTISETIIDIDVPINIEGVMDEYGVVHISDNIGIYNYSETHSILIEDIQVSSSGLWDIVEYSADFDNMIVNSKYIGMSLNGHNIEVDGTYSGLRYMEPIEPYGYLELDFDIKIPGQNSSIESRRAVEIIFVLDWYEE